MFSFATGLFQLKLSVRELDVSKDKIEIDQLLTLKAPITTAADDFYN